MGGGEDRPAGTPTRTSSRGASLIWAAVAAADLALVVLAAIVTLQGLSAQQADATVHARNLARVLEGAITATLEKTDLALRSVADEYRRVSLRGGIDAGALEVFLARHRERTPDLVSIRITGPDGVTRYNAPPVAEPVSLADRDFFQALRDAPGDELFVSRPVMGRIVHVPVLIAARRLTAADGSFAGIVSGAIAVSSLQERLARVDVGAHGTAVVRWKDLALVASAGAFAGVPFGDTRASREFQAIAASGRDEASFLVRSAVDGVERRYAMMRLARYPLVVTVGLAPTDYLADWRRQTGVVWGLVGVFVLLTGIAARVGVSSWRRRLAGERLLVEQAERLRASEERLRIAFQTSRDSITITRLSDSVFVAVNEGFVRMFGYREDEALGRAALSLGLWADPAARARMAADIQAQGFVENLETRFFARGGRVGYALVSGRRIELDGEQLLLLFCRDITDWKAAEAERDRLQLQVQQAQRLEGIGRLAGGVAHDFNNLLTVILSCVESLREQVGGQGGEVRDDIDQIGIAAGRARDLTRQLLAVARKQVIAPVALDLAGVVRDGEKLLRRVLGEDIVLDVSADAGLWPVLCDPAQLEQVILNLAVNARDAMPSGGTLAITARNAEVELLVDPRTGERRLGQWVRLSVRDSGTGMTPEVQSHLFEPFFTTKPMGKGTGLGLAMVHGIVSQNGGHIEVESEPGRGTRFDVFLPRAGAAPAASPQPAPSRAGANGGETILVIEDDPLVRNVTVRALRSGGYEVLVAGTGADAVALAAQHPGRLDLVVTDVVMPGLAGPQVVEELRRARPGVRALFVSGYPQDAIAQRGVLEAGMELLPKPFTSMALLERVRALLGRPQPDRATGEVAETGAKRSG